MVCEVLLIDKCPFKFIDRELNGRRVKKRKTSWLLPEAKSKVPDCQDIVDSGIGLRSTLA
jgi:hypothetical protein